MVSTGGVDFCQGRGLTRIAVRVVVVVLPASLALLLGRALEGLPSHTKFFTSKVRQSIFEKGVIICESFTRKPRRNELFLYFRERHGKTRDGLLPSATNAN